MYFTALHENSIWIKSLVSEPFLHVSDPITHTEIRLRYNKL